MSEIAVIGGGAAGFFAAIHAAEAGSRVTIFEKSNKLLSKVRVSGGGRCNVTNSCADANLLSTFYPRGSKELRSLFSRFNTTHTHDWFVSRGVPLKAEADGRVFPVSDRSESIVDCLMQQAVAAGIVIKLNSGIIRFEKNSDGFLLTFQDGRAATLFDKVIVAAGGFPNPDSYSWLSEMHHTIIKPVPSLFTFNIPDPPFKDLMGVAVPLVRIKIAGTKLVNEGPMLFTHWGLSGPAVLKLSSLAARELALKQYQFIALVSFIPESNEHELIQKLNEIKQASADKKVLKSPFHQLPSRLWEQMCNHLEIDENKKWGEISKSTLNRLAQLLTACEFSVKGKTTFKEEFVTCGGVSLKEVNMQTMESKLVPGLYFAGEILDIDGVTGGFNFQAAWSTGYVAGLAASQKK